MKKETQKVPTDSDLVTLTKEYESIKNQLQHNEKVITDLIDSQNANRIERDMIYRRLETQQQTAARHRRILEVQLRNVQELLQQQFGDSNNNCASIRPVSDSRLR